MGRNKVWIGSVVIAALLSGVLMACTATPAPTPTAVPPKPAAAPTAAPAAAPTAAPAAAATAAPAAPTAAPAAAKPAAPAKVEKLKMVLMSPVGVHFRGTTEAWAKDLQQRTNGALSIEAYNYTELGLTGFDLLGALKKGTIDIAETSTLYMGPELPVSAIIDLPYLILNFNEARTGFAALLDSIQPELDKFDAVRIGGTYTWGPSTLMSKKPVKSIDDYKGLKVRVYGTVLADMAKVLGASPVTMPFSEVYSGLQRGVAEAAWSGASSALQSKWNEVVGNVIEPPPYILYTPVTVLINKNVLNRLPQETRDLLLSTAQEHAKTQAANAEKAEAETFDLWRKAGAKVEKWPDSEVRKAQDLAKAQVWPQAIKNSGPTAEQALQVIMKSIGR